MKRGENLIPRPRPPIVGILALACLMVLAQSAAEPKPGPVNGSVVDESQDKKTEASSHEIVVYSSDLPESALSEFDFKNVSASPGGKMIITPNTGDELDPPPEDDPHVIFKVKVQRGVQYRCWIHMKVGAPKGKSQANKFWVQFSDAVDMANKEIFKPGTGSFLTAQGPTREGWSWVACDLEGSKQSESLVSFKFSGEITVRLQAGMEGVGFDQFVLSSTRFLEKPPAEAVVKK